MNTDQLHTEIARLTSELSALQTECDHLRVTRAEFKKKVSDVAEERDIAKRALKRIAEQEPVSADTADGPVGNGYEVYTARHTLEVLEVLAADVKPPLGSPEDLLPPQEP